MQRKIYPKNKAQFKKLLVLYGELLKVFKRLRITPIAYGSFTYFLYTKDPTVRINDIDVLVPKNSFKKIDDALTKNNINHKFIGSDTIEVSENNLKLEIDAYPPKINLNDSRYVDFGKLRIKIISLRNLRKIYKMAVKESKHKTAEYKRKYGNLSRI